MAVDIERMYVDLIFRASKKYASWDPEIPVRVGDYGWISQGPDTSWLGSLQFWRPRGQPKGRFVKEGNIYDNDPDDGRTSIAKDFGIPDATVREHGKGIDRGDSDGGIMWITSKNVRSTAQGVQMGGGVSGLVTANVQTEFEFRSGRGAVLGMKHEEITAIDHPGKLFNLLDSKELRDRVLVSEVHQCSAYIRYVANQGAKRVVFDLGAEVPVPVAPGISTGAGFGSRWRSGVSVTNYKKNADAQGNKTFYPLFRLVAVKEKGLAVGLRGGTGNDELPDVEPPWDPFEDEEEDDFAAPEARGKYEWI